MRLGLRLFRLLRGSSAALPFDAERIATVVRSTVHAVGDTGGRLGAVLPHLARRVGAAVGLAFVRRGCRFVIVELEELNERVGGLPVAFWATGATRL